MLLAIWYDQWKRKRLSSAVEQARKDGYAEGFEQAKREQRQQAVRDARMLGYVSGFEQATKQFKRNNKK